MPPTAPTDIRGPVSAVLLNSRVQALGPPFTDGETRPKDTWWSPRWLACAFCHMTMRPPAGDPEGANPADTLILDSASKAAKEDTSAAASPQLVVLCYGHLGTQPASIRVGIEGGRA